MWALMLSDCCLLLSLRRSLSLPGHSSPRIRAEPTLHADAISAAAISRGTHRRRPARRAMPAARLARASRQRAESNLSLGHV